MKKTLIILFSANKVFYLFLAYNIIAYHLEENWSYGFIAFAMGMVAFNLVGLLIVLTGFDSLRSRKIPTE